MKEFDSEKLRGIEFSKDDNIIAYCNTCKTIVFLGNNSNQVSNIVLRKQIFNHIEWFHEEHQIDVIEPNFDPYKVTEAVEFVVKPWLATRITKLS